MQITVVPPANADSVPVRVTATPKGAFDPNQGNNTTDTTTDLVKTKLAGGGFAFGCNAAPTGAEPGAVAGLFATLSRWLVCVVVVAARGSKPNTNMPSFPSASAPCGSTACRSARRVPTTDTLG